MTACTRQRHGGRDAAKGMYLFLRQDVASIICAGAHKVDWQRQVLHVLCDPAMRGYLSYSVCWDPIVHNDNTVLQWQQHCQHSQVCTGATDDPGTVTVWKSRQEQRELCKVPKFRHDRCSQADMQSSLTVTTTVAAAAGVDSNQAHQSRQGWLQQDQQRTPGP